MGHFFSIVLPLIFLATASVGAGWLVLRRFPVMAGEAPLFEIAIAFLLGQGILGIVFHIPALTGIFSLPVILLMTIPLSVYFFWVFIRQRADFEFAFQGGLETFKRTPILWQAVAIATGLLLLLGFSSVAGILTADAQAFYLALPKVIAASHRLVPLPGYEQFTSVGLIPELQLAALFLFGMPEATPRLYCWMTATIAALVLSAIARNAGLGKRGQLLCLSMLATSSAVTLLWGQGKTDFFAAAYGLAAVYFAQKSSLIDGRKSAVIFTGLFTGFALVAKLSYIVALLPALFVLLVWRDVLAVARHQRNSNYLGLVRQYSLELAVFTMAAAFSLVPHFIKNLLLLGMLIETYGTTQGYFTAETTRHIVLHYPMVMVFGDYWAQYGNLSALVLAFLPLAFIVPRKRFTERPVLAIFCAAFAGLFAWVLIFPSIPMPRYFLATLALLAIPAAWAAEKWAASKASFNFVVCMASLAIIFAFYKGQPSIYFPAKEALVYLFVPEKKTGYEMNTTGPAAYSAINASAPAGARVYLQTYFRFWLRPDLIQTVNKSSEMFTWQPENPKNPEEFWRQIHQHGFSYLLVDTATAADKTPPNATPPWVKAELLASGDGVAAYRLYFINPPGRPLLTTKEVSTSAWDVVPAN